MLRDNRNSSNCFQKLIFAEKSVFAVTTLDMNNLLNHFWIIWPQVIHFLFSDFFSWPFLLTFLLLKMLTFVNFLLTKCCHISGAIPVFYCFDSVWLSHWGKWSIYGAKKWCDPTLKVLSGLIWALRASYHNNMVHIIWSIYVRNLWSL